jgi:hypothetical protein
MKPAICSSQIRTCQLVTAGLLFEFLGLTPD